MTAAVSSISGTAQVTVSDNTSPPSLSLTGYRESNGLIVIEAEEFQTVTNGTNGGRWIERTDLSGFSGSGFMRVEPVTGLRQNKDYAANSPMLAYRVNFVTHSMKIPI